MTESWKKGSLLLHLGLKSREVKDVDDLVKGRAVQAEVYVTFATEEEVEDPDIKRRRK